MYVDVHDISLATISQTGRVCLQSCDAEKGTGQRKQQEQRTLHLKFVKEIPSGRVFWKNQLVASAFKCRLFLSAA